jgi:hypothetical protein
MADNITDTVWMRDTDMIWSYSDEITVPEVLLVDCL